MPLFSSSSYRFYEGLIDLKKADLGEIRSVISYGPAHLEPHHPDLFWYGVHGSESLFTVMGMGCETVQRGITKDGKIEVIGHWNGGRKGVFREDKGFHGSAKGSKGEAPVGGFDGYVPLVAEIMRFFQTGVAPVKPEETIEIFAFMEAADESKRQNGAPVRIADMLARARK